MTKRQLLTALVSIAALALGIVTVVEPALLFDAVPELEAFVVAIDPSIALLGLVGVLAVAAVLRSLFGRRLARSPPSLEGAVERETFSPGGDRTTVGAHLDERFELATAYDNADRKSRERARAHVEEELRSLAVAHYAQQTGCGDSQAAEAVSSGEWTDDRRAAAFLAGEEGPTTPLSLWLVDLFTGRDSFEQGVERTIETIRGPQRGDRQ